MLAPLPIGRPLSLSRSHKDAEKSSRPERRRPRRHQQVSAMTLRQDREIQRAKMRGKFLRLLNSKACLMRLNTNNLSLPPLTTSSIAVFSKHLGYDGRRIRHNNAAAVDAIEARAD